MRYRPESQLSKSINLQRSLQNGRYGLPSVEVFLLQMGQRIEFRRRRRRLDLDQAGKAP